MSKKGKGRGGDAEDLDLVPIMNLVTILIPFLLMASSFVTLAAIDSTLPAIGPPVPVEEEPDKPPLNLSIAVTDEGFTIMGADAVLNPDGGGEPAAGGLVHGRQCVGRRIRLGPWSEHVALAPCRLWTPESPVAGGGGLSCGCECGVRRPEWEGP